MSEMTYAWMRGFLLVVVFVTAWTDVRSGWNVLPRPTSNHLLKLSFVDHYNGWVAGSEGTILRTSDGGMSWSRQTLPLSGDVTGISMIDVAHGWALSSVRFVDTSLWFGTKLIRTTNGGDTWGIQWTPEISTYFNSLCFVDTARGFLGGRFGELLRTTDGGAAWLPGVVDSILFDRVPIHKFVFFNRQYGFAVGGAFDIAGLVFRTTSGGERWSPQPVSGEPVFALHFVDSTHLIGLLGDYEYGAKMIRSNNAGLSWTLTSLETFGQPNSLSFRTRSEGWSSMEITGQFLCTLDSGGTWQTVDPPLQTVFHDLTFPDSTTGYAVGNDGTILRYSTSTTGAPAAEAASSIPRTASLHNYPNPFNASTEIRFSVEERGRTTLEVFTPVGQKIATLFDDIAEPGQYYSVRFDASRSRHGREGIAGGMYLYRLLSGKKSDVKKLILLK